MISASHDVKIDWTNLSIGWIRPQIGPLSKLQPMSWEQRLTSAIGAAAGEIHLKNRF